MTPKKSTKKPASRATSRTKASGGFTAEEKEAMRDRVRELKGDKTEGADAVLAKIAAMPEPDRTMGKRLHEIIMAAAPDLTPRLWYGMPAYAKDEKVVCFFQNAQKFKTRYATLGFSDKANLDEGDFWPVSYALRTLTSVAEAKITGLVKRAVS